MDCDEAEAVLEEAVEAITADSFNSEGTPELVLVPLANPFGLFGVSDRPNDPGPEATTYNRWKTVLPTKS